ncbi:MAG: rhomboid family intramembrane serine protease [Lachnospiraceae bacterium]|nr:rhomboid family intramembrane serine protease [Lachnospiraceae bacterium]
MKNRQKINSVTNRLIVMNTAVFLLGILQLFVPALGSLPLSSETGGIYYPAIAEGQWWRIITAMFLHANIAHLASNMIALFALGSAAEKMLGHWRYALTYFLAGIAGNLLTVFWDHLTGRFYYTVGASGAILGILGAILAVSVNKKDGIPGMNVRRVVIACILMLIPSSGNISMTAHLGGFAGGFAAMYVIGSLFPRTNVDHGQ